MTHTTTLIHYGVKGMRWNERKGEEAPNLSPSQIRAAKEELRKTKGSNWQSSIDNQAATMDKLGHQRLAQIPRNHLEKGKTAVDSLQAMRQKRRELMMSRAAKMKDEEVLKAMRRLGANHPLQKKMRDLKEKHAEESNRVWQRTKNLPFPSRLRENIKFRRESNKRYIANLENIRRQIQAQKD